MDAPNRPRCAPTKFDRRRIRFASVGLLRTVPHASSMLAYHVLCVSSHTPRLEDDFQAVDHPSCPAKLSSSHRYSFAVSIECISIFYFQMPSIFLPRRYRFYIDLPFLSRHRYSFRESIDHDSISTVEGIDQSCIGGRVGHCRARFDDERVAYASTLHDDGGTQEERRWRSRLTCLVGRTCIRPDVRRPGGRERAPRLTRTTTGMALWCCRRRSWLRATTVAWCLQRIRGRPRVRTWPIERPTKSPA